MNDKDKPDASGTDCEDQALWRLVTRDIKPIEKPRPASTAKQAGPQKRKAQTSPGNAAAFCAEIPAPPMTSALRQERPVNAGLDRRSAQRLRRGQMEIEARLDLHGLSQARAHDALRRFLLDSYKSGRRCVLVITGKGRKSADGEQEPGILRRRVPDWLGEPGLAEIVLRAEPAQPRDGGSGALYILLRRQRRD